jgi:hypothetical protein
MHQNLWNWQEMDAGMYFASLLYFAFDFPMMFVQLIGPLSQFEQFCPWQNSNIPPHFASYCLDRLI